MGPALRSGAVYFAIVFIIAFVLGVLRTLIIAPRLGETPAVLFEAPIVLAVSWFVAKWCVRQFRVPAVTHVRLTMGCVAFVMLMVAELGISSIFFDRSVPQYLAGLLSVAGALGLGSQVAFAWVPLALTWRSWSALDAVRAVHTVIYVVMATSTFVVLFAVISGATGPWLWLAAILVGIESVVFLANGLKCPLTAVAAKFGAGDGADTFLPERITRYTFRVFGPLILIAAVLAAARWGPWRIL